MKKFIYSQLLKVIKKLKPKTQLSLAQRLISDQLAVVNSVEGYKIRRHLLDKYLKSYPTLYSHEAARIHGFFDLLESIKQVPGDLVECGVGRGRFLSIFCYANSLFQLNRKVYGFDSFTGFPVASEKDLGSRVQKLEKISGWDDFGPELIRYVISNDLDCEGSSSLLDEQSIESVRLIPGFFKDTLDKHLPDQIAFLHLDADLYESTIDILENSLPRMSKGGVMVLDELHETEKWPGVQKAVAEICEPAGLTPKWNKTLQRYVIYL